MLPLPSRRPVRSSKGGSSSARAVAAPTTATTATPSASAMARARADEGREGRAGDTGGEPPTLQRPGRIILRDPARLAALGWLPRLPPRGPLGSRLPARPLAAAAELLEHAETE